MKGERASEVVWSILSIVIGGIVWITMPGVSWGIIDPSKVGLVVAVIGVITLGAALFSRGNGPSSPD